MKKIRTAIIGLGQITHGYEDNLNVVKRIKYPTHLSALKKDKRFLLVSGCDKDVNSIQKFRKKVGQSVSMYLDYLKMIKEVKPDLLIVASPTTTHYAICQKAIKAGVKFIFCEKPISFSLNDSVKLVKLADRSGVSLFFNYFRNFDKSYKKLKKKVKDNKFGEIKMINVKYSNGIFNTATHLISLLEMIVGPIKNVCAFGCNFKLSFPDPTISFVADFGTKQAVFEGLSDIDYRVFEVDFIFSHGRIKLINDVDEEFRVCSSNGFSFLELVKNSKIKININNSFLDVYNNIYWHIRNGSSVDCTSRDALHSLGVATQVIKSFKLNKKLSV